MSDESDNEKELPASERKIQKAREEGQIPRSKDFAGACVVLAGILTLWLMSGFVIDHNNAFMKGALTFGEQEAKDPSMMAQRFVDLLLNALWGITPFLIAVSVVAILASVAVGGFIFSTKALEPKFSKLNPLKGLKNMFSANALFELVKSIVKVVAIAVVSYFLIKSNMEEFPRMMVIGLPETMAVASNIAIVDTIILAFAFAVIVVADVPLQLYKHYKQLRMNIEEVKKEQKDSDGDPHVKARIKQIQMQQARKRMMSAIKDADVIVTNPTHFAVALSYKKDKGAPRVVAKGMNELAQKIKEVAKENNVAQIEAPPLARALYKNVELDREIPQSLYSAVAKLLAYLYSMERGSIDESVFPTEADIPEGMDPGPQD